MQRVISSVTDCNTVKNRFSNIHVAGLCLSRKSLFANITKTVGQKWETECDLGFKNAGEKTN